jgi:hypothetical protein
MGRLSVLAVVLDDEPHTTEQPRCRSVSQTGDRDNSGKRRRGHSAKDPLRKWAKPGTDSMSGTIADLASFTPP